MIDLSNENIIHVVDKEIQYIQFRKLLEYKDMISHCFTLRDLDFGIRSNFENNIGRVFNNYEIACKKIGMDYINSLKPGQNHTSNVVVVNEKINKDKPDMYLDEYKNIDGVITNKRNIVLSTVNADCILLLFFDPVKRVIADVHAGWRGTFSKISQNVIKEMVNTYNSDPEDIICCMSPSIRVCHFEVEEDVKNLCDAILSYTGRVDEFIKPGKIIEGRQKYYIDTIKITEILLLEMGLRKENIIDSKICSVCDSEYIHSRRAGKTDLFKHGTALIGLK